MDKFIIFTKEYEKELADCLCHTDAVEILSTRDGYYFTLTKPDFDLRQLVGVMENMILTKNPALTHSTSLRRKIREMVFAKNRDALVKDLERFIQENAQMNWDGYLQFRLSEFAGKVNLILYSIVKKSITCFMWIYV